MKRAVLFDFDLTLADSTRGAIECINYALGKMGLPHAEHQAIKATIGLSLPTTLVRLTGLTDCVLAKSFTAHFVECADLRMVDLTWIFPDASSAVHELRKAGIKTGIVSTKYRYRIEAILARDGLTDCFDVIVGGEDVGHHKPDPEGLHRALKQIGLSGQDAVYVGDHPVDAMAASAAGIPFAAILTGNAVRDDFDQWSNIRLVESLPDLVPLLTANWGSQSQPSKRSS
jgi:phosphoglycolate phosphatase